MPLWWPKSIFMDSFSWYATDTSNDHKPCMKKSVPLCSQSNLQLRFLCHNDIEEVQALCQTCFPIYYPYSWYLDITSNPRFYSLAAVYDGVIIGLIVAEIKPYVKLNEEDQDILSASMESYTQVGYILSLGVSPDHRRNGVASLLLDNLISHLTTAENSSCKAVFLHVLTTNSAAIQFYEQRHFRLHSFVPFYYFIGNKFKDGFTYVLYINGGHPPWGVLYYARHFCQSLCRRESSAWLWHKVEHVIRWLWNGARRMVHDNGSPSAVSHYH
ncbi:unnamed protein product [Bemisia tabaci]|uniref:N-alpha-acetyltransferase 60 n=1 Tax=Bemisia tabaci TaxID=7038 RepID=A0A9N9ZXX5_BEMTA|nr:unnamed protein product [Bemisia tabaci]